MYTQILKDTPFLLPATEKGRQLMQDALAPLSGVEVSTVGYSIRHRPINMYKFGNGGGRVAFFGAHHALESITANILYAFVYIMNTPERARLFAENAPALFTSLYTYYVVPCLNPDGIEIRYNGDPDSPVYDRLFKMSDGNFHTWQANGRGVDLNHNYEYGFAKYKKLELSRGISPGPTLYSGEYPESEPESRLAANLVRILSPRAVVSLHSQGEEIFYAPISAERAAHSLAAELGYAVSLPTDTACYGGLCDYTGHTLGIPSFTIEIGRGKNPLPESSIPSILKRLSNALMTLPKFV